MIYVQPNNVFTPAIGDRDLYDLRQHSSALFPPEYYTNYLAESSATKISAVSVYSECCPNYPYDLFAKV